MGLKNPSLKKKKKGETGYVAHIKEVIFAFVSKFKTVLDCGLYALDSGFFVSKFSFGIPDSLSCILNSVAQDFGFQRQKLSGLPNPDSPTNKQLLKESSKVEKGARISKT